MEEKLSRQRLTTATTPREGCGRELLTVPSSAVIFKYNPQCMSREDVLATFVGREALLSQMIAHLRKQRGIAQHRHLFFFGPRGSGKTTMLLMLRYTIEAAPGLNEAFDIVQFSEEERRVVNLPSFSIRILELLAQIRSSAGKHLEKARSAPDKAFDILIEAAESEPGRQVLLLLDNFDDLVLAVTSARGKRYPISKEEALNRMKRLLSSPGFCLVAAALQSPEKRKDFPKDLLELFAPVMRLGPLEDAMPFLRKRAEKDRRTGFLEHLPSMARRIDGLHRLSKGNPRLLVFLYDCLGENPLLDLVEIVQRTVDDLTPMYQDVIDRLLNRGQAAVLEMLVAHGGHGTAGEIAETTYQDEQTVRTFLTDLCDLGLVIRPEALGIPVREEERPAREIVYRTDPPLFQIWYEMRHNAGEDGLYLVRFFSLLGDFDEARDALKQLKNIEGTSGREMAKGLMREVTDILDPEWGELQREYVDKVIEEGGSFQDVLNAVNEAVALPESSVDRRIALLVIRSGIKRRLGYWPDAENDLREAEGYLCHSSYPETGIKLLTEWSRYLDLTGQYDAAANRAEEALQLCSIIFSACLPALEAAALLALASARNRLGDNEPALKFASRADDLLRNRNASLRIRVTRVLGNIYCDTGKFDQAKDCYESSLHLSQQSGIRNAEAIAMNSLGNVYYALGDYERARDYYEKSLVMAQQIGDCIGESNSLNNLGLVYDSLGDYERAKDYYEKSIAMAQQIGDRSGEAISLGNLGLIYDSLGDYERAKDYYETSVAMAQQVGDRGTEARSLNNLGLVYDSLGDYERAKDYHKKSLAMAQQIGARSGEAASWHNLGLLARKEGLPEEALNSFRKAYSIYISLGMKPGVSSLSALLRDLLFDMAASALQEAKPLQAESFIAKALRLSAETSPDQVLAALTNNLVVPCLRHSLGLASQLLPFVVEMSERQDFLDLLGRIKPVRALLEFYLSHRSGASLKELGPSEMFVFQSLRDRIERPLYVEARELFDSGETNEAEEKLEAFLALEPDYPQALLLKSLIEQNRGEDEKAVEILQGPFTCDLPKEEVYAPLAKSLRRLRRFEELVEVLMKWRDAATNEKDRQKLDVWIPEAQILSGNVERAVDLIPDESVAPEESADRLLAGALRVFAALYSKDGEAARRIATKVIELAAEFPAGKVSNPLGQDLLEKSKEVLGSREFEFFAGLGRAIAQPSGLMDFATEFLSESETAELSRRVAEEGELALDALKSGGVRSFGDLSRVSTRSIGPTSAIAALGDGFAACEPARRVVMLDIFIEALRQEGDGEIMAALGALGKNMLEMEPAERSRSLEAMIELSSRSEASNLVRDRAVRVLNVLYPNLDQSDRDMVRNGLEEARTGFESPALSEFFTKIIPLLENEEEL